MVAALNPQQVRFEERSGAVLDFVRRYYRRHGIPATLREVANACRLGSTSVAVYHLDRLAGRGHLRWMKRGTATYYVPVHDRLVEAQGLGHRAPGEWCPTCGCEGHDGD